MCQKVDCHICPICIDNIKESDKMPTLCGHYYHDGCLKQWLLDKNTCPMCRTNLYNIEERQHLNEALEIRRNEMRISISLVKIRMMYYKEMTIKRRMLFLREKNVESIENYIKEIYDDERTDINIRLKYYRVKEKRENRRLKKIRRLIKVQLMQTSIFTEARLRKNMHTELMLKAIVPN